MNSKTPHNIKDIVKQAIKEHKAFREEKKNGVVSMEAVKRDKENIKLVMNNTKLRILKAARSASSLNFVDSADLEELAAHIDKEEVEELCKLLSFAILALMKVKEKMKRQERNDIIVKP